MTGKAHRYAVFYAPAPASALDRFGTTWLGRDHASGAVLAQPAVPGMPAARLQALTAAPRRYGFHGTLKAPFRLAEGRRPEELHAAAMAFAAERTTFVLQPLRLADLEGFLALVPSAPSPALGALAADCVTRFEPFRAPSSNAEIARRRPERLNPRQRRQLDAFGYPWIFEDFTFHLTLTECLGAPDKAVIWPRLEALATAVTSAPFVVDAIAIYEQTAAGSDFVMTGRYRFGS